MPSVEPNTAFSAAGSLAGARVDPFSAFNFLVEIDGMLAGGFSECSGLSVETDVFEYREGGVNDFTHRFAGATKSPNLVLKHGLTVLDGLWEWHQDVVSGTITRRNGSIFLLDERRVPLTWWDFRQAYPVRWNGPDLQAGSASVAFETIELVHQGLSRPNGDARLLGLGADLASRAGF